MDLTVSGIEESYEHIEGDCNIMGNGNDLVFKNCRVLVNLMGNSNTIRVVGSQAELDINGNGNRVICQSSSFLIGINGNGNQLEHTECSAEIKHINGFGNEAGNGDSISSNRNYNEGLQMASSRMGDNYPYQFGLPNN